MPRAHPLEMEAVAVVEPDRERVVADPPVEPDVGAPPDSLGRPDLDGRDVRMQQGRPRARREPLLPGRRRRLVEQEHGLEPLAEPLREAVDHAALDENARRERVGEDEPHRSRAHGAHPAGRPASSQRRARA